MVSVVTWNVNSVKSRLEHLEELCRTQSPDVILLQELKCETDAFPREAIEDCGYNIAVHGQKTYNGVAILSKYPIEDVITQLPGNESDEQARYIEGVITFDKKVMRVASIYVPNGKSPDSDRFQYKLHFFDCLQNHARTLLEQEELLVLGGDYNVAPYPVDVYNPKHLEGHICFHPEERKKFRNLLGMGLSDGFRLANPNEHLFSWWDYRAGGWQNNKGMRIDHLLLSPESADKLSSSSVLLDWRDKEKPSDHAPVLCSFNIK